MNAFLVLCAIFTSLSQAATQDRAITNCFTEGSLASDITHTLHHKWLVSSGPRVNAMIVGTDNEGYKDAERIVTSLTEALCTGNDSWNALGNQTIDLSESKYSNNDCVTLLTELTSFAQARSTNGGVIVIKNLHLTNEINCLSVFMDPLGDPHMHFGHNQVPYTYQKISFLFIGMWPSGGNGNKYANGNLVTNPLLDVLFTTHRGFSALAFLNRISVQGVLSGTSDWTSNCTQLPIIARPLDKRWQSPQRSDSWSDWLCYGVWIIIGVTIVIMYWPRRHAIIIIDQYRPSSPTQGNEASIQSTSYLRRSTRSRSTNQPSRRSSRYTSSRFDDNEERSTSKKDAEYSQLEDTPAMHTRSHTLRQRSSGILKE